MCALIVCLKTITESVNFGHLNRKTIKEKLYNGLALKQQQS